MIRTNIVNLNKGDIFCVLPGNEKYINIALKKGARKIIVNAGNYGKNTITVRNTRSYLNHYLKRYSYLINTMKIIGILDNRNLSYIIYKILKKCNIKVGYISKNYFYKNRKICCVKNKEIDEIYNILLDLYMNNYKYVIIDLNESDIMKGFYDNIKFSNILLKYIYDIHILKILNLKKNGKYIVSSNSDYFNYLDNNEIISYGILNDDYRIQKYSVIGEYTIFKYLYKGKTCIVKTKIIGLNNIYNLLSIIIVLRKCNINIKKVNNIIRKIKLPYAMDYVKYKDTNIIMNEVYNFDDLKNSINDVKIYKYKKIYSMINTDDSKVVKFLNKNSNLLYINSKKELEKTLNRLGNDDVLLIIDYS